jgi:hypothetical protein
MSGSVGSSAEAMWQHHRVATAVISWIFIKAVFWEQGLRLAIYLYLLRIINNEMVLYLKKVKNNWL